MLKYNLTVLILGIILIITLFTLPAKVLALSVCQSTTGCTAEPKTLIGANGFCTQYSQVFQCPGGVDCYIEYDDQCTFPQPVRVCNAPHTPASSYNCATFCDQNIPTDTLNRSARIVDCLANSCRDARGAVTNGTSGNYTCSNACSATPTGTCQVCTDDHGCITPSASAPAPTSTCPLGPAEGGITYSCQTGSSCPGGNSPTYYKSGLYTCSSGNTCCYTSTIKYKCVNNACSSDNGDGTGTYTENGCGGTCSTTTIPASAPTAAPAPTTPPTSSGWCHIGPASSTGPDSGTASVTYSGFDRMDWKLNGILAYPNTTTDLGRGSSNNFTNLSPNTTYTVTGIGWGDPNGQFKNHQSTNCTGNPSFITGRPDPPPPSSSLVCFRGDDNCGNGTGYWHAGSAGCICNCPQGAASNVSDQQHVGGVCYSNQPAPSEPVPGVIRGNIYLKTCSTCAEQLAPATGSNSLSWGHTYFWIYNEGGYLVCSMNDGRQCLTGMTSLNGYYSGADAVMGDSNGRVDNENTELNRNGFTLISWPIDWKPAGYYTYQGVDTSSRPDPNPACGPGGPYEGNCDSVFDYKQCNQKGRSSLKTFGDNDLKQSDYAHNSSRSAKFCMPLSEPNGYFGAKVDLVFQKLGRFPVSGHVYKDDNRDGIRQTTGSAAENTTIPNAAVTLNGVNSTQTDANGYYIFNDVIEGTHTLSAQANNFYPTNPVNGTATISFTAPITQDFLMKKLYKVGGTVRTADTRGNCPTTRPGYLGAILTLTGGTPSIQPQSRTTTGSGSYLFPNLDQGTYSLSAASQASSRVRPPFAVSISLGPDSLDTDFCVDTFKPWIQTSGDIHSNTKIDLPPGPTR